MTCIVAVDAGTTGVRALVIDNAGQVTDIAYRELAQYFPRPGWVEHDATEIIDHVRATLLEVAGRIAERGERVAALGITNQRETVVAWDRSTGAPLHRAIVWQDKRTRGHCRSLREAGHLDLVRSRTGLMLDSYFSATKMAWLAEHGALSSTPVGDLALGTVDSWVLWHLSGAEHGGVFATDPTNASRTLLYDIDEGAWSDELCALFGVERAVLADVRPSCGRFAVVSAAALGDGGRGLAGVPISGIAGDQQAALFGQACFASGMVKATYGTGSFVLANVGAKRPPPPAGLLTTVAWDLGGHGGEGGPLAYALEGSAFVSGAAIQWLRDGLAVIERSEDMGPLAGSVADSGGVYVVPAFTGMGSPWWDESARGTITGITRGAGRAQLARATVEAMAYQVRAMVEAMVAATGTPVSELRVDGGASAMDLLLSLQADQLATCVARPTSIETTALGAATLAGLAEGVWDSLDELSARWSLDARFEPAADRTIPDALYAAWQRAVERARHWAREDEAQG